MHIDARVCWSRVISPVWRDANQPLPDHLVRSLRGAGATVVGLWYRDDKLLAILDLGVASTLREGLTVSVGRGGHFAASMYIEAVDGRSAIAVVTLLNPPLPNNSLQLTGRPLRDRLRQPGTVSSFAADRRCRPAA